SRGEKRANTYLYLLNNEAQTPLRKLAIIYALLASHDGETLQKYVYTKMGFSNLQCARDYFQKEIRSQLHSIHSEESEFNTALNHFNENVISKIVAFANSDTDISDEKTTELMIGLAGKDERMLGCRQI